MRALPETALPERPRNLAAGRPIRALVVASWYPAFDDPVRGIFVADHVRALREAGVEVVVASFEAAFVRGALEKRAAWISAARESWRQPVTEPDALNAPRTWGAGAMVARLPAVLDSGPRTQLAEVAARSDPLLAFGTALADRWPFDIIHAHTGLPDGAAALPLAERLGVPIVVTEHDTTVEKRLEDPAARAAYLSLVSGGRRVVTVSRTLATALADNLGLDPAGFSVIPNPVAVDAFASAPAVSRDEDELLWVGVRRRSKGIGELLEAFARVRESRPGLRLRMIGRAPDDANDDHWRAEAARFGVAGCVSFEPQLDRPAVAAAMKRASVFVHPSRYETFGIVAAEALAAGLPVVTTPTAVQEIVGRSGAFGEVALGSDPPSLAAAIERLLGRRAEIDPSALLARARDFEPAAVAARTVSVYRELLEGERPTAEGDAAFARTRPAPVLQARDDRPAPSAASSSAAPGSPPDLRSVAFHGLVLATDRPESARIVATLPDAMTQGLTIVTTKPSSGGPAAEPPTLPSGPSWIEIDPDAAFLAGLRSLPRPLPPGTSVVRRAMAFMRHPLAVRQRRRLHANRDRMREQAIHEGLRHVLEAAPFERGGGQAIVAVSGDDAVRASALSSLGARLTPGSLRWLADSLDPAGAEVSATTGTVADGDAEEAPERPAGADAGPL